MSAARAVRALPEERIGEAMELVWTVFQRFEAPDYQERGIREFADYIRPEKIRRMARSGELRLWCCLEGAEMVGVLAARQNHVSLLFVAQSHHRRGIARSLLEEAKRQWAGEGHRTASVNASPYGLEAYRRLGFRPTGEERTVNGLRFTPMELPL